MSAYRRCVAILLRQRGKFFVGERIDTENAWQLPQGGVDSGEAGFDAAVRELYEETGVTSVKFVGCTQRSYKYDFSAESQAKALLKYGNIKYMGQEQRFFVFDFLGQDTEINLQIRQQEFKQWRWADISDILSCIVNFKRTAYLGAIEELKISNII